MSFNEITKKTNALSKSQSVCDVINKSNAFSRVILHSDCNCFYASVECLYNPSIRNKPVAVSGDAENRHGIILTKNEIAKKFGVKTGEAIWQAQKKCPELITVPPRFDLYRHFSKMTRNIYNDYTDQVEGFGLDEAWLDVTGNEKFLKGGNSIAIEISKRIKQELGITVSIGVSFNKIFAKFGSDYKKPDTITVINRNNYKDIIWNSPAGDLLYVGPATQKKMHSLGIYTIGQIALTPIEQLRLYFGKWGDVLWGFANGYDASPVLKTNTVNYVKSISNSTTTPRDMENFEDVKMVLCVLCESVSRRLREQGMKAKTISINGRDKNLYCFNKQHTIEGHTNVTKNIIGVALKLFLENFNLSVPLRSIGISVSDLVPDNLPSQLSFDADEKNNIRLENLDKTVDNLKKRFGNYSLQPAVLLKDKKLCGFNPYEENTIHPVGYF